MWEVKVQIVLFMKCPGVIFLTWQQQPRSILLRSWILFYNYKYITLLQILQHFKQSLKKGKNKPQETTEILYNKQVSKQI